MSNATVPGPYGSSEALYDPGALANVPTPHASLVGRRVALRQISMRDYDYLFALTAGVETAFRWRQQPGMMNPAAFGDTLWRNVFAQFIVVHCATAQPVGLVSAYNPDMANRTVYVASLIDPEFRDQGWPLEGSDVFIRYLFEVHGFRKLYGEAVDFNMKEFRSILGKLVHVEGRLRRHFYIAGEWRDMYILAIHREDWEARPRRNRPSDRRNRSPNCSEQS
jgi:RimJ/RimL family protein N-acetyltransferase